MCLNLFPENARCELEKHVLMTDALPLTWTMVTLSLSMGIYTYCMLMLQHGAYKTKSHGKT